MAWVFSLLCWPCAVAGVPAAAAAGAVVGAASVGVAVADAAGATGVPLARSSAVCAAAAAALGLAAVLVWSGKPGLFQTATAKQSLATQERFLCNVVVDALVSLQPYRLRKWRSKSSMP